MGPVLARRKRANVWSEATRGGPIPGSVILPKVNQSGRVWQSKAAGRWAAL